MLGGSPPLHLAFLGSSVTSGSPHPLPFEFSPARWTCPGTHFLQASLSSPSPTGSFFGLTSWHVHFQHCLCFGSWCVPVPLIPLHTHYSHSSLCLCLCCAHLSTWGSLAPFHVFHQGPAHSHLLLQDLLTVSSCSSTFLERLLCASYCPKCWGWSGDQDSLSS